MRTGRALQFNPDLALETFRAQSFKTTSLQDLLAGMGLFKSSFYQSFGDKH